MARASPDCAAHCAQVTATDDSGTTDDGLRCPECSALFSNVTRLHQHRRGHRCSTHNDDARLMWMHAMMAGTQGEPSTPVAATTVNTGAAPPGQGWVDALARARIVNHAPRDVVDELKHHVKGLIDTCQRDAVEKVAPHLAAGADAERVISEIFQNVQDVLQELAPQNAELRRVREHHAYVQPKKRYLGARRSKEGEVLEDFYAYDGGLKENLEAMFATRPDIWAQVESFVDRVLKQMRSTTVYNLFRRMCC